MAMATRLARGSWLIPSPPSFTGSQAPHPFLSMLLHLRAGGRSSYTASRKHKAEGSAFTPEGGQVPGISC